jgi:hypothetical protein
MRCPECGTENGENNFKCTQCGVILHPASPQVIVRSDDTTLGGLMPLKNPPALVAYYLGIFSLIPLLGIPMGIAAVVMGIKALRNAREHPEVKGKVHAWIGIIAAGFFAFLYLVLTGLFVFGLRGS